MIRDWSLLQMQTVAYVAYRISHFLQAQQFLPVLFIFDLTHSERDLYLTKRWNASYDWTKANIDVILCESFNIENSSHIPYLENQLNTGCHSQEPIILRTYTNVKVKF